MIEIPEALTIANQINNTIKGKKIINVIADHTPHKFAWYHKNPQLYRKLLIGKTIENSAAYAGMVEIKTSAATILISEGVSLIYHKQNQEIPKKHQLLLKLEDSSIVTASVQMYGGLWCFNDESEFENPYYKIAKEKPSPLSDDFNKNSFNELIFSESVQKLSTKAFLATDQRIPGLGNGVLQDILWTAKIHPKRKISSLQDREKENLYNSIKTVLSDMKNFGGRDTEKDFFGNKGSYKTMMSKNNIGNPCPICGSVIKKEAYLGGSIYYCEGCQVV